MLKHAAIKYIAASCVVGAFALTGCIGNLVTGTLHPELRRNVSGKEPAHEFSDELYGILPESKDELNSFSNSKAGRRVSQFIGRGLTPQDIETLAAMRRLIAAQRSIRQGDVSASREHANAVLNTGSLSLSMYQSALRYLTMADIIELTEKVSQATKPVDTPRSPFNDFNTLQNLQCASACSSTGWQTLVREIPTLFTVAGYRRSLISEQHFQNEGMSAPRWLKKLWETHIAEPTKVIVMTEVGEKKNTELTRALQLRSLAESRRWNEAYALANKINSANEKLKSEKKNQVKCRPDFIFSQFVLAQSFRMRQDRKQFAHFQEKLMTLFDSSECRALDFGMEEEQFEAFKLDGRLWLARLEWEQNKNPQAFHTARMALNESLRLKSWEHYFDAAKIVVGRIGFEMLSPAENIALLTSLENAAREAESDDFPAWLNSRKGLIHFIAGEYGHSQKSFERVIEQTSDNFTRAMAFYWMGRTTRKIADGPESDNSLLAAGKTDPLSIYDIFSGQLLDSKSGRASTQAQKAISGDWQDEHRTWMSISETSPLKILTTTPITALTRDPPPSGDESNSDSVRQFEDSLRTTLLLFATHKAMESKSHHGDLFQQISDSPELAPEMLRGEVRHLRQAFTELSSSTNLVLPKAHQVAWLTHAVGDFANAILFVGRLRNAIGWDSDYLPFLYFIFYPRPYYQEFLNASQSCGVDIDLLYAISRQESLFQSAVKSPAGAVGLMQLLPSTAKRILASQPQYEGKSFDLTHPATNTLAGSCYLKDLLKRYDNNLAYAIAAYNAGEGAVDNWIARREKLSDIPYFIEFIPYAETQTYVQRVLRNYYNIKWIYQRQN